MENQSADDYSFPVNPRAGEDLIGFMRRHNVPFELSSQQAQSALNLLVNNVMEHLMGDVVRSLVAGQEEMGPMGYFVVDVLGAAPPEPRSSVDLGPEAEETSECSICLDSGLMCTLSCSHKYHTECIGRWLENNDTCPTCRSNVRVLKE